MTTGELELELTDVLGGDLNDTVTIELFDPQGKCAYRNREKLGRSLRLTRIKCDAIVFYRVAVTPARYRLRQAFVAIKEGKSLLLKLAFPVNPGKVSEIAAPDYNVLPARLREVLEASDMAAYRDGRGGPQQGKRLYGELKMKEKACLLNLYAKTSATMLASGRSCFDYMSGLTELRQDRFFARTKGAFEEDAAASSLLCRQTGALHKTPAGYRRTQSFKTRDEHGNLQLTFFRRGDSGDDYVVDADIDEGHGIEHIFEVIRNRVTGRTNPFDIREILIASQKLDPGYTFIFS